MSDENTERMEELEMFVSGLQAHLVQRINHARDELNKLTGSDAADQASDIKKLVVTVKQCEQLLVFIRDRVRATPCIKTINPKEED